MTKRQLAKRLPLALLTAAALTFLTLALLPKSTYLATGYIAYENSCILELHENTLRFWRVPSAGRGAKNELVEWRHEPFTDAPPGFFFHHKPNPDQMNIPVWAHHLRLAYNDAPPGSITIPTLATIGSIPGLQFARFNPITLAILCAIPPFASAALTLTRRRRQKQRNQNSLCPTCGYDLRASPTRCPECGATTPSQQTHPI